jgi:hypothetical protein
MVIVGLLSKVNLILTVREYKLWLLDSDSLGSCGQLIFRASVLLSGFEGSTGALVVSTWDSWSRRVRRKGSCYSLEVCIFICNGKIWWRIGNGQMFCRLPNNILSVVD